MEKDRSRITTRVLLRSFQRVRAAQATSAEADALFKDLELVRHLDTDLSIKAGALLAFQGLILMAGINIITASPGSPLSVSPLDAPWVVLATALGVALLAVAATFCVRCIMIGEYFDDSGLKDDPDAIAVRMLAAHCAAIDKEKTLLAKAVLWTYAGGAAMVVAFFWALIGKWI